MVKVCHLSSVHPPNDGRIFHKECVSLSSYGYEVYFVVPNASDYVDKGVNIVGVESKKKNRLYRIFFLTKKIYKKGLELDADIYHLHDPELLLIGGKLIKKGKKVIFDSHEDVAAQISTKTWLPKFLRKVISYLYSKFEKKVLKKYNAIISVTPSITNRLAKINNNTYQITNYPIIPNYDSIRIERRWGNSICFAGGISEQWFHHNIIQALDSIEGVRYRLVGFEDEKYLENLEKMKSWDKVDFDGKIPHNQVIDFISESTVGMALNDYSPNVGGKMGSLGNTKLFEYMRAGIPVICTDFILWRQIVDKWNCGICVNPNNVNEIVSAIQYIFNNPDIAKQMGDNGLIAVNVEYNWRTQEEVLLKLYKDLQ